MKLYEVIRRNRFVDVNTDHPINVGSYIVNECEYVTEDELKEILSNFKHIKDGDNQSMIFKNEKEAYWECINLNQTVMSAVKEDLGRSILYESMNK